MTEITNNMKKSKIPHIFHVIPSFAHGGAPILIAIIMNHFGRKARHSFYATNGDYGCRSRIADDVDFNILDIGDADKGNIFQRTINYRKIIRDLKPDILATYHWGAMEWAMANSFSPLCRHVHMESGFGPDEAQGTMPKRNLFRRLALRNIGAIIVPSNTLANICKKDWKFSPSKIHYIPNGVNCEQYAAKAQEGIIPNFTKEDGDIVIGTMTPLRPEKNLSRLITAFRDLLDSHPNKKFKMIIMGEGNEREKTEKMITDYGLNDTVYLPGHIDQPENALGWLDIYAISSDTEQMPTSLNQAMAASLPVVGLDVGDVKFMMHDQNKPFIVPAGDDAAFTKSLIELVTAEDHIRKDLGRINKKHVKDTFDEKHMFRYYAKMWNIAE